MQRYKIGQLSKTMGVSTHLLKHYEKFQLVEPNIDQDTNYRYYDLGQCSKIIECKKFRNMGFSIKDTATILNESDNDTLNQQVQEQVKSLDEQIQQLQYQRELATMFYKESIEADERMDEWFIERIPKMYFLPQSNNQEMIEEHSCYYGDKNIIDTVPVGKSILYYQEESFNCEEQKYNWGIGILEEHCETFGIQIDERYQLFDEKRAFVTYIKVKIPYINTRLLINKILSQFYLYKYDKPSNAYAVLIKSVIEDGIKYQCLKVIIPLD